MPQCKICGSKYSFWTLTSDELCSSCREKAATERQKQTDQIPERARAKVKQLLSELAPNDECYLFGVALWDTTGSKVSSTAQLWTGRALLGIGGDILHSDTHIIGLVGVSHGSNLYTAKIGQAATITPEVLLNSSLDHSSATRTPIAEVFASGYKGLELSQVVQQSTITSNKLSAFDQKGLELRLSGNKTILATFPSCCISDNSLMPQRLLEIVGESQPFSVDENGYNKLIADLKSTDWEVRLDAVKALRKLKDQRSIEPLTSALQDSDSDIREVASKALNEISGKTY